MRIAFFIAPLAACILAGCQTTSQTPIADWQSAPLATGTGETNAGSGIPSSFQQTGSTKLGSPVNYEGTGRFVAYGSMSGGANPDSGADGVKLNFVDVPVAQAAKVVLSDILSLNYVVDPKVTGKVTIQTSKPVTKAAALDLFQSALRSANAALVENDGLYKVVPLDQASAAGTNLSVGAVSRDGAIGSGLRVVQLKYVSATNMKLILDPIAPHGGVVRADPARNVLVLSGSPAEMASMLDAISIFDVDTMRGMSFGVVPVKTSNPDALADNLRQVFNSEKKGPMSGMLRFIPNRHLGAILVISPQPRYIALAESWIKRLDAQAQGNEQQFFTYDVQNRPAKDLVGILKSVLASGGKEGAKSNVAPREQQAELSSPAPSSNAAQAGSFGALSPAGFSGSATHSDSQSPAVGGASSVKDSDVMISADEANNALIVRATPQEYKGLLRLIHSLDVMPSQVLIQATIAEVSLNDELKFGVRWFLQKNASSATFTDAVSGAVSSVFPGFSYALQAANAQVTLNALAQITHVSVLSSPSLMVLDNKTATLQVGDQVPISTQSAVSVLSAGAPVVNSVAYKDTGVILTITPRINQSGRVLLDIQQEVSSVAPTTSSNIDSPTIQQRKIKTTVVLNDGQSLTLGGLIQKTRNIARDQVPILGDLPVIGAAFRSKDDLASRTELIIIITPRVVHNLDEAQKVTNEYRRKIAVYAPRMPPRKRGVRATALRILK